MPLPHLLPNILFPRAFTNNVYPNHSQGRGLRGRGYPTSWWGRAGQKRVPAPLAHLRLWQTHPIPGNDTSVNSWRPLSPINTRDCVHPLGREALHPGTLLDTPLCHRSHIQQHRSPHILSPILQSPQPKVAPTLAPPPRPLGPTAGRGPDEGGHGHPKGLLP